MDKGVIVNLPKVERMEQVHGYTVLMHCTASPKRIKVNLQGLQLVAREWETHFLIGISDDTAFSVNIP